MIIKEETCKINNGMIKTKYPIDIILNQNTVSYFANDVEQRINPSRISMHPDVLVLFLPDDNDSICYEGKSVHIQYVVLQPNTTCKCSHR
jgi:hypothetical protein